ncbi:cyclase family protein [Nocardioides sp. AN3]
MSEQQTRYADLPLADGGARSGWGAFGAEDEVGTISRLTPARVREAARLVRTGDVFPLNAPLDEFDPPLFGRAPLSRTIRRAQGGLGLDDVYHDFNPQASSQWDGLGHFAFKEDVFFNGASLAEVEAGRNGIEAWATRGIVGRGVLLDLWESASKSYDPGSSHTFGPEDLEAARNAAGVEHRPGDILLLRTGFLNWYRSLDRSGREKLADKTALRACGLEHTERMASYLWDLELAAVVADNPSLEVWPLQREEWPFGALHHVLIAQFGMAIGELWDIEALAAACQADGRHEFLLTSAPLHARGGFGSTANALAIK